MVDHRQEILYLLRGGNSKETKDKILNYVGDNEEIFSQMMDLFTSGTSRENQIVSWALSDLCMKSPQWVEPFHEQLLTLMVDSKQHAAMKRNCIRLYQTAAIPEAIEGVLYDRCIRFITDPQEAIAVKAHAITVGYRIVQRYPQLADELRVSIESILEYASAGVKNRALKTLAKL